MVVRRNRRRLIGSVFLAAALAGSASASGPAQASDPAGDPAGDPVAQAGSIRTAQQLLIAIERVDERVDTLSADVQYDRRFRLQGDQHIRRGKLWYAVSRQAADTAGEPRPARAFEISFSDLWLVADGRKEQDRQTWVFDGRWLVEKYPDKKQFIAREIAGPGDDFDPLSIKEGIMPIPIGQRAADVLERFEVELVDHPEGLDGEPAAMVAFVAQCYELRLVPKESFAESAKFKEIRLWYEKQTLMPRMTRAVDRKGDVSFVQLLNVKRNERLPRGVMVITPPPADAGWDVQIERRRDPATGPAE